MDNIEQLREHLAMAQQVMVESLKSVSAEKDMFKNAAKCYKNLYDALVEEGFTQQDALEILKNYNPIK